MKTNFDHPGPLTPQTSLMQSYLLVFIGGGLGSLCRFGIAQVLRHHNFTFPWATLGANIVSCILLGALVGWSMKDGLSNSTRLLMMTGFCGGFSTFSTFTLETYDLLMAGNTGYAFANIFGSLLIGLIGIFLGLKLSGLS